MTGSLPPRFGAVKLVRRRFATPGRASLSTAAAPPAPGYPQAMSSAMKSAGRLRLSAIVLAWIGCVGLADALERPGDADNMEDLRRRATAATAIHRDFQALIDAAPRKEKFELYRTYDASTSTWVQIGFLRDTLDASIAAP